MTRDGIARCTAALLAAGAVCMFAMAARVRMSGELWATQTNRAIEHYAFADRSITRDILSARVGLLRNYDMINQDFALADRALERLQNLAGDDPALREAVAHLARDTRHADAQAEQFKTANALLQNSLARVTALCNQIDDSHTAGRLSARFLRLTLDTGPEAVAAASRALAEASARTARDRSVDQLVVHGRLLLELLPRIDRILEALRKGPLDADMTQVRNRIAAHQLALQSEGQRMFGKLLALGTALSLMWIVLMAYILIRAREARSRRENERLSATVARLLLEAPSQGLRERIEDALHRLSSHAGARGAFLVVGRGRVNCLACQWSTEARSPDDWARRIVELGDSAVGWHKDVLIVDASRAEEAGLACSPDAEDLGTLMLIRTASEHHAVLGLEFRASVRRRADIVAGLRMAQAAILQALRRDRLERARLTLERRLAQARRMEAIGAVASGVAHNFNNIVGAISGFNEIAGLHAGRNLAVQRDLAEIGLAVGRARALVNEILDFARGFNVEHRPLVLSSLVEETVRLVSASKRGTVSLDMTQWPPAHRITGHAAQIQQVMMNICNNAFQADALDPHVTIRLELRMEPGVRQLSHGVLESGEYALIAIGDRGPGMDAAILHRLFEPFFTGCSNGTGLGLSTAWEIVQEHGGTIDVESRLGQGSIFGIWLPICEVGEAMEKMAGDEALEKSPEGNGERVLVIANRTARHACEDLVASLGYEPLGVDPDRANLSRYIEDMDAAAILLVGATHVARILAPGISLRGDGDALLLVPGGPVMAIANPLDREELAGALAGAVQPLQADMLQS